MRESKCVRLKKRCCLGRYYFSICGYRSILFFSVPKGRTYSDWFRVLTKFCISSTHKTSILRLKIGVFRPANLLTNKYILGTRLVCVFSGTGGLFCCQYPQVPDKACFSRRFLVPVDSFIASTRQNHK